MTARAVRPFLALEFHISRLRGAGNEVHGAWHLAALQTNPRPNVLYVADYAFVSQHDDVVIGQEVERSRALGGG